MIDYQRVPLFMAISWPSNKGNDVKNHWLPLSQGQTTMAGEFMGIYREYGYFFVSSFFLVTILSKSKKLLDHQVLWLFLATWWQITGGVLSALGSLVV